MSISTRVTSLIFAAALVTASGYESARADDTEIFVMTPPAGATTQPNILFIMDTSGSMATQVVDRPEYNPATTYSGSCSTNRVYWNDSGTTTPPDCNTDRWVSDSNFVCKTASDKLAEFGSWPIGPAAQWRDGRRSDRWDRLAAGRDTYVECKADTAIRHGLADADDRYPADEDNGPYSSNISQTIGWSGEQNRSYIFYSGNYINWYRNSPTTNQGTRLSIVKQAAKSTLDRLSNVNVGLMRFSSDADGGMVIYPMTDVGSARTAMKTAIDNLDSNGGTPLSETFLEAYRYWTGDRVGYGLDSTVGGDRVLTPSVDASRTGASLADYRSPLGSACQKNFIVYLTDGDPTSDASAESTIEGLPNFSTLGNLTTNATNGGNCTENGALGTEGGGANAGDGKCLDDLAKYMFEKDFYDDPALPASRDPKENIRTYTIGFGDGVSERGLALLRSTATAGGGEFYEASDSASLTEAFNSIIRSVLQDNLSFTAPAVSVNAFNRTQNLNDLFITVFKPDDRYHWPGNLKKYRLRPNGNIVDADGNAAIDENEGFFRDDARSYWSAADDGSNVELGGAANRLPANTTRNVYTDLVGAGQLLSAGGNLVVDTNTAITRSLLGLPGTATAAERTALITWIRGFDTTANVERYEMGDPLHSRPVSVIYGGTVASPDAAVFVATNDGYLHAIDPSDGSELWAYVPSELLPRMNSLYQNLASDVKRYGLDGNLAAYRIDRDGDGIIETGDRVLLFFGMGRGGDNYYALDVTNKRAPRILWRIGGDDELPGLSQSWSTPVIAKVLVGNGSGQNADRLVMIVGGGYDPTQDNVPYNTDNVGNKIYMVDAISGDLLWSAGQSGTNLNLTNMNNSIPGDVRVLDMTNDGFADRMYASDTGGRIWRFDIYNGQEANALVTGGMFASLGVADVTSPTTAQLTADARRFYVAPDVSLLRANNRFYLNIAIGSGFRGHPLNTEIRDAFYSLRDPIPFVPMTATQWSTHDVINAEDLVDVTTNATPVMPVNARGWKIDLNAPSWGGEKVLSEARTFAGSIIFPTYKPSGNSVTTSCTAQAGTNALYVVNVLDGSPPLNRDGDATPEPEDRAGSLDQSGIAPPAAIFFPTPEENCTGAECKPPPACLVGVENCGLHFSNAPKKTFWSNQDTDVN